MRWYEYRQNNSGGSFKGPAINVHVEAESPSEANERAENAGLYFDGVNDGIDCPCCDDRWFRKDGSDNGYSTPSHYGTPLAEAGPERFTLWGSSEIPEHLLVYRDGRKEIYTPPTEGE